MTLNLYITQYFPSSAQNSELSSALQKANHCAGFPDNAAKMLGLPANVN